MSVVWTVGHTADPAITPERFVPATVPGAVQLDWARAEGWPPYWQGENFRAYGWMEDVYWVYRAYLAKPTLAHDQRLVLVCGGVDYACLVRVDGTVVHQQEGMFSAFTIDLTAAKEGALLEIAVSPAPKTQLKGGECKDVVNEGRALARQSCKPAVSYGWDFHPRLIPLGIWDETFLEIRPAAAWLDHVEVAYDLSEDFTTADLRLLTEGSAPSLRWTLLAPDGSLAGSMTAPPGEASLTLHLENPALWWPLSEGAPSLYTSTVETLDSAGAVVQTTTQRIGLRRMRLIMAPGQFSYTHGYPASQPPVPITFEINGRPIFARGANWACPEIFPGTLTTERYREQLDLFAGAHLNLLRSWGGAIVNKDAFFDLCDERGIMVWQEFPLACNCYEGTPAYLRVLDSESRAIIRRLRRRACVVLWCGGNELFNGWSGMTMQDHALRLLDRNCFDLDPARPFLPTSPLIGIRHGDYRFKMSEDLTAFQNYQGKHTAAYMEFGVPAPPSAARLRELIPAAEIWPIKPTASWVARHAFGAWNSEQPGSWLYPEVAEHYFGPPESLEELVQQLQLLQAEGYKAIYEEGRRQKPTCSAVACWAFNEPWPTAANNSLVAWPNTPKPGYHAVAAANRPTMASARIPRFDWLPGSEFSTELFLLHDGPQPLGPCQISARLESAAGTIELGNWSCPGTAANTHAAGPVLNGRVPDTAESTFTLLLTIKDHPEWSSSYTLATRKP